MTVPVLAQRNPSRASSTPRPSSPARLRVVPSPAPSYRRSLLAMATVFVTALIVTLAVNIHLASGAYELSRLTKRSAQLGEEQQVRSEELAAKATPEALCRKARSLGLVPAGAVGFVRLSDGTVTLTQPDKNSAAPGAELCVGSGEPSLTPLPGGR